LQHNSSTLNVDYTWLQGRFHRLATASTGCVLLYSITVIPWLCLYSRGTKLLVAIKEYQPHSSILALDVDELADVIPTVTDRMIIKIFVSSLWGCHSKVFISTKEQNWTFCYAGANH
jgi:hypothetical protein